MKTCRSKNCLVQLNDDARFCPKCGLDQSPSAQAETSPSPGQSGGPSAGQNVVTGMGYTFGGCIFVALVGVLLLMVSLGGCALMVVAGSNV